MWKAVLFPLLAMLRLGLPFVVLFTLLMLLSDEALSQHNIQHLPFSQSMSRNLEFFFSLSRVSWQRLPLKCCTMQHTALTGLLQLDGWREIHVIRFGKVFFSPNYLSLFLWKRPLETTSLWSDLSPSKRRLSLNHVETTSLWSNVSPSKKPLSKLPFSLNEKMCSNVSLPIKRHCGCFFSLTHGLQ